MLRLVSIQMNGTTLGSEHEFTLLETIMNIPRTMLERISRGRILQRRLPAEFGSAPIVVSPDAGLRFWKTQLRSDLFDFAAEFVKPGSVVWDVGANVGLFSVAAAHRAEASGKVIAVEADIWLVSLLRKSAAIQPPTSARIQVIPAAAFDSQTIASFNIANRGRASNFLSLSGGHTQTGGVRETVSVLSITLDWLLEQVSAPHILKIDVEGAECNVLRGAQRVLSEAQPVILIEVSEKSRDEVTELLVRLGYTLFDWDACPRVQVDRAEFNTLAIPNN
ncbi:MAG: FkbM family methyltransferase [Terracidiphilus sp.]